MDNMHEGHRARLKKRFQSGGLGSFEDHNILELVLFYAQPRKDTNGMAHDLLDTFGSLEAVFEATPEELMTVKGVGENAATLIHLIPAVARRYMIEKEKRGDILGSVEDAGRYLAPYFLFARSEMVYLLCLDAKLKVLDCRCVGTGGLTFAQVNIREIVHTALLHNARYVILAHNHTSGIALPSNEDRAVTTQVRDALALVDVILADHIIVAGEDYVSMADDGFLG